MQETRKTAYGNMELLPYEQIPTGKEHVRSKVPGLKIGGRLVEEGGVPLVEFDLWMRTNREVALILWQ